MRDDAVRPLRAKQVARPSEDHHSPSKPRTAAAHAAIDDGSAEALAGVMADTALKATNTPAGPRWETAKNHHCKIRKTTPEPKGDKNDGLLNELRHLERDGNPNLRSLHRMV